MNAACIDIRLLQRIGHGKDQRLVNQNLRLGRALCQRDIVRFKRHTIRPCQRIGQHKIIQRHIAIIGHRNGKGHDLALLHHTVGGQRCECFHNIKLRGRSDRQRRRVIDQIAVGVIAVIRQVRHSRTRGVRACHSCAVEQTTCIHILLAQCIGDRPAACFIRRQRRVLCRHIRRCDCDQRVVNRGTVSARHII